MVLRLISSWGAGGNGNPQLRRVIAIRLPLLECMLSELRCLWISVSIFYSDGFSPVLVYSPDMTVDFQLVSINASSKSLGKYLLLVKIMANYSNKHK